jgi:spermidine/putrescine transport system substrate-binding protein
MPTHIPGPPSNADAPGGAQVTRRVLLRRGAQGAAMLFGGALLAACDRGTDAPSPTAVASAQEIDPAAWWLEQRQTGRLNFANWPYYIDTGVENTHPSLDLFFKETGIHVHYFHPIQDNDSFLRVIQPYLEAGVPPFQDLVVMTNGPEVDTMIASGWLTPLDQTRLTNFHAHASDLVRDPVWDPGNTYSAAWQSGLTGIAYRPEAVKALGHTPTSIQDLFDPALEGRVGMMANSLDLGSTGLLAIGADPATSTETEWRQAAGTLREQRGTGVVRSYYDQGYVGALRRGDIWITQAWSGDIFQLRQAGQRELSFVVPDEGALLWTDNMLFPINARHPLDAMTFIDFVYRPDVAAMIADWVWYICPVPEARDIIANDYGDIAVADSPLVFPTAASLGAEGALKSYPVFDDKAAAAAWSAVFDSIPLGL